MFSNLIAPPSTISTPISLFHAVKSPNVAVILFPEQYPVSLVPSFGTHPFSPAVNSQIPYRPLL